MMAMTATLFMPGRSSWTSTNWTKLNATNDTWTEHEIKRADSISNMKPSSVCSEKPQLQKTTCIRDKKKKVTKNLTAEMVSRRVLRHWDTLNWIRWRKHVDLYSSLSSSYLKVILDHMLVSQLGCFNHASCSTSLGGGLGVPVENGCTDTVL